MDVDSRRVAAEESVLQIGTDENVFEHRYGYISHHIEVKKKGQKIAVRSISQFGEESIKVGGL